MLNLGDLCVIWSGEGEHSDPKNYLLGFVVKKIKGRGGEWNYRVIWNDLISDRTYYHQRDIELIQVEDQR